MAWRVSDAILCRKVDIDGDIIANMKHISTMSRCTGCSRHTHGQAADFVRQPQQRYDRHVCKACRCVAVALCVHLTRSTQSRDGERDGGCETVNPTGCQTCSLNGDLGARCVESQRQLPTKCTSPESISSPIVRTTPETAPTSIARHSSSTPRLDSSHLHQCVGIDHHRPRMACRCAESSSSHSRIT